MKIANHDGRLALVVDGGVLDVHRVRRVGRPRRVGGHRHR